ncbi:glycosyltransferase family 39 protein [Rickettsiella grylli]|uniref:Dolichyl-phosphate-mannose-protein mannosyltransferase family protein n=1 Tax=Rickettsiella grylli TaxID=59196 RepID=A8PP95_9COXI|nr:glycosyltransferase family 39 protein [Rickettsiella grylli]EDP46365.1 dolichyl-phosphate-mannose-protein mannosyltransferase family protein [Rickettsiella grylli]
MLSNLQNSNKKSWYVDLILLAVGIAFAFGLFLGTRPLSVPDEGRYAEIPREMLVLHDFVTPHLNGVKYFEKPPLVYWLQAGSISVLNPWIIQLEKKLNQSKRNQYFAPISEWTVRLPNALVGLLGCLFVYASGRILFERRTGLLSAIILASSLLYFSLARLVTLDMTLTVCLSVSLLSFLMATNQPPGFSRRCLFYNAYVFSALAVLTKGLVGILFPMMIVGTWILVLNQWYWLKKCFIPSGLLLFFIIVLPWHSLVQFRNPEFFQFYFIDQQFLRYSTSIAKRYQPDWFFIPVLMVGFLPWICFLPQAIRSHFPRSRNELKKKNNSIFLLLWISLIFIFFSFSHSKLIPYVLPIFPALALLTGHFFSTYWEKPDIKWGYFILSGIGLGLGGIGFVGLTKNSFIILSQTAQFFLIASYRVFLFSSLIASFLVIQKKLEGAFLTLAVGNVISFLIIFNGIPYEDTRSIKPLVIQLNPLLKPNDKVVVYYEYYQDLPFYLNRRVITVNIDGELGFGMRHQSMRHWAIKDFNFWPTWNSSTHIYMITNKEVYQQLSKQKKYLIYLIAKTPQNVLLTNHLEKNNSLYH